MKRGIMNNYIVALVKITDYPKDLLNKGLFCHPWKYYSEGEKNERFDPLEMGASVLTTKIEAWNRLYSIVLTNEDLAYMPVFCWTAIFSKKFVLPPKIKLSEDRFRRFGKQAIIITDVKELIKRIEQQLPSFCYSVVEYLDFYSIIGPIKKPITTKDNYFKYQQEFRIFNPSIALKRGEFYVPKIMQIEEEQKLFTLGDIKDIAMWCSVDELFNGINVSLNVDWEFCHKKRIKKY
jgi:hypothetical protein